MIRISTGPDGTEISPMRAAEARPTLGVAAARTGDIDEAIGMGTTALEADRKALPSLLLDVVSYGSGEGLNGLGKAQLVEQRTEEVFCEGPV